MNQVGEQIVFPTLTLFIATIVTVICIAIIDKLDVFIFNSMNNKVLLMFYNTP